MRKVTSLKHLTRIRNRLPRRAAKTAGQHAAVRTMLPCRPPLLTLIRRLLFFLRCECCRKLETATEGVPVAAGESAEEESGEPEADGEAGDFCDFSREVLRWRETFVARWRVGEGLLPQLVGPPAAICGMVLVRMKKS